MAALYLNNKFISTNDDLLSTFELLIDDDKRPEFLQDEILEAFYSCRLSDFLVCKPEMIERCKKIDEFREQCCQDSGLRNGRNDIIKRLSVLLFDEIYNLTYNYSEFLQNLKISLLRNDNTIDRNNSISFNKNVIRDNDKLYITIQGEAIKIINDKINFIAKIYDENNTEAKDIAPITLTLCLSNRKQNETILDRKSLDINKLKSLKEGKYRLVIEDVKGQAIDSFEFTNEYAYDNEIPVTFLDYSVSERGVIKEGVFFNRKNMVEEYVVSLNFKVLKTCNARIKLGISCQEFNFDYNEDDNHLIINGESEGDVVTYDLPIKCNEDIINASDGRHKITISPFKSLVEFTNVNVYIFGTSRFVKFTDNDQTEGTDSTIEFISYCDDHCLWTTYISKCIIETKMLHNILNGDLLTFALLANSERNNKFTIGEVEKIISHINDKSRIRYRLTPTSILVPFMNTFIEEIHSEESQFTSDKKEREGLFTTSTEGIIILNSKNSEKLIEEDWPKVEHAFRLCFCE